MKLKTINAAVISGLALVMSAGAIAADAEVTITGEGACAKCVLKEESKECQSTITVGEGDLKVKYYLARNEVAREFGDKVCKERKKTIATGTIKFMAGKRELTPSKIELAKE